MKLIQIARFFMFWQCLFAVLSCQTVRFPDSKVPERIERLFSSCGKLDGGIYLSVYEKERFVFATEMDWISSSDGSWSAEAYSSFGQTIGRIDANVVDPSLKIDVKKLANQDISVNREGRVFMEGHYVGLSLREIPCIMKGRLPIAWRAGLIGLSLKENSAVLHFTHDSRDIVVNASHLNTSRTSYCSYVSWSQLLGLISHKYEICHLGTSTLSSYLKFENGVKIKWVENPSI